MKTVGVFDSGVGGLSVLRALRTEMPGVHFVYVADSAFAPYGERAPDHVADRADRITNALRTRYSIDALVVACNTATAHAVEVLRQKHPDLPIVGVEPALKPAAAASHSGHVGVLATRGTVQSDRFARLRADVQRSAARPVLFTVQACDGLADAIERQDDTAIEQLIQRYTQAMQQQAGDGPPIDTVVLGCTHYPFAANVLRQSLGQNITLIDTGAAVARRTRTVLGLGEKERPDNTPSNTDAGLTLLATGPTAALTRAAAQWLASGTPVGQLDT